MTRLGPFFSDPFWFFRSWLLWSAVWSNPPASPSWCLKNRASLLFAFSSKMQGAVWFEFGGNFFTLVSQGFWFRVGALVLMVCRSLINLFSWKRLIFLFIYIVEFEFEFYLLKKMIWSLPIRWKGKACLSFENSLNWNEIICAIVSLLFI